MTLTAKNFKTCPNMTVTANEESKSLIYGLYISSELLYTGVTNVLKIVLAFGIHWQCNANISNVSMAWKHGHTTDDVLEGVKYKCH